MCRLASEAEPPVAAEQTKPRPQLTCDMFCDFCLPCMCAVSWLQHNRFLLQPLHQRRLVPPLCGEDPGIPHTGVSAASIRAPRASSSSSFQKPGTWRASMWPARTASCSAIATNLLKFTPHAASCAILHTQSDAVYVQRMCVFNPRWCPKHQQCGALHEPHSVTAPVKAAAVVLLCCRERTSQTNKPLRVAAA